jgi:hypothetical protein
MVVALLVQYLAIGLFQGGPLFFHHHHPYTINIIKQTTIWPTMFTRATSTTTRLANVVASRSSHVGGGARVRSVLVLATVLFSL